jgi:16S rRNA (uracil1498-N3)-methyltransferase
MHRFFIDASHIESDTVRFPQDAARQITRVLRIRDGEQVIVLDDTGMEYVVTLKSDASAATRGRIDERRRNDAEPAMQITLYQGLLKQDRFDWVLQKCTELGVSAFVPVQCERSITTRANRADRWRRIIREAAEQCGRGRIPLLRDAQSFAEACESCDGPALIPWEGERATSLQEALSAVQSNASANAGISVFIGPEGGFSEGEIAIARARGITPVTLGKRILRAETAAIATVTALQYHLGELG